MSDHKLEAETDRLTHLLKDAVQYSRISNREVERRMGYSSNSGYLSRLFNGSRELKVRQVLQILQTLGMSPSSYFHAVYPEIVDETPEAAHLRQVLESLHPVQREPETTRPETPAAPQDPELIERMLREALRRMLLEDDGRR
ncbi:MAG TPA: hypothetical protein VHN15_01950 [Thermoanaerobaculia bacterium]|nr:hypothetical protein [Thermoanaerobaculia bacterium]